MSNQTFYLKYRPALISELDNEEVAERLTAYLKTGHVPHAFLLVGHKGTGKTSSARLIAKAVNCGRNLFATEKVKGKREKIKGEEEISKNYEPCNNCELCQSITLGNNPDVLEIDAASNTGVDNIRDLRDKILLSPSMSRYKVYIIDEVHMLSKGAFNALLKTLEEPPENTVFILATTELEKVPDTVVSRCIQIDFKRADAASINKSVNRIIKGEKLIIKQEAVDEIIAHASGSFRDAAKILEQAVYLAEGKEITKEIVEKVSGGENGDEMYRFLGFFTDASGAVGTSRDAIQLIENLKENNVDLRGFVKQILEVLHQVLLQQVGIACNNKHVITLSTKLAPENLKTIVEHFEMCYQEMKFSDVPELPVELAILEILDIRGLERRDFHGTYSTDNISIKSVKSVPRESHNLIRENPGIQKQDSNNFWINLISKVNAQSRQVAAVLRSCKLKSQNDMQIVVEAVSQFHLERLRDVKATDLIEKCACEILHNDVKIVSVLKNK